MGNLKQQILDGCKKNDIDLVGFAPKERFDGLDGRYNPFSIFPEGKTVILVGQRITRGTLRGVEEGTNFGDYHSFGFQWLDTEFTALACYDTTRILEDAGFEAVPVFPNPPESYGMGVAVAGDRPAPNVAPDFNYAVVACGLGEIGFCGEILTKQFGTRQRFQMIITDAELESSPLLTEGICNQCGKCADACPLGAIDKENFEIHTICGKSMKVANINYDLCRKCANGAIKNNLIAKAKPDRIAALCMRTCMCELEESGRLNVTFQNKFRKRKAWGIDLLDKSVDINL